MEHDKLNSRNFYPNDSKEFWEWFQENENHFFEIVEQKQNIQSDFLFELQDKLQKICDSIFFLTGMLDDQRVELIFSSDGIVKHFAIIEDIVNAAPKLENWIFVAHKPALASKDIYIEKDGFKFNVEKIGFAPLVDPDYPDEIEILVVHEDFTENNKSEITSGVFIFLDHLLGEINFGVKVDLMKVNGPDSTTDEIISIEKLPEYLNWREKEFIEKYEGTRHNTETDQYGSFKGATKDDLPVFAVMNTSLLNWESKGSHPWIAVIKIEFDGTNNNGLPDELTYQLLDKFEDELMTELIDFEGYLNVGRETYDGLRKIFFACKDYRKPSRVLYNVSRKYTDFSSIEYDIYKDKYWQTFARFQ